MSMKDTEDKIEEKSGKALTKGTKYAAYALAGLFTISVIGALSGGGGKIDLTDPVADNELRTLNNITKTNEEVTSASTVQHCDFHVDSKHKEVLCHEFNFETGIVKENYHTPGLGASEASDKLTQREIKIDDLKGDDAALASSLQKKLTM